MTRRPPRSTLTTTLVPYTTPFRSRFAQPARNQAQQPCGAPGAAEPCQHGDDRVAVGTCAGGVEQQERHRVVRFEAMLGKQAAPDGVLHRREAELARTVVAQEETDPAAAQRADAVEHHDGLIGGWVSWIRRAQASPRSGSVARTAAARLRPRTCSALPPDRKSTRLNSSH